MAIIYSQQVLQQLAAFPDSLLQYLHCRDRKREMRRIYERKCDVKLKWIRQQKWNQDKVFRECTNNSYGPGVGLTAGIKANGKHQMTTHQDCHLNASLKPAPPPASTTPAITPATHTPAVPWAPLPNAPVLTPATDRTSAVQWAPQPNAPAITPATASTPAAQWAPLPNPNKLQWWTGILLCSDPMRCDDEQGWTRNCCCEATQCAAMMNRDRQATAAVKQPNVLWWPTGMDRQLLLWSNPAHCDNQLVAAEKWPNTLQWWTGMGRELLLWSDPMCCGDEQGWTGNWCCEATQHAVIINWWLLRSDPTRRDYELAAAEKWPRACCIPGDLGVVINWFFPSFRCQGCLSPYNNNQIIID